MISLTIQYQFWQYGTNVGEIGEFLLLDDAVPPRKGVIGLLNLLSRRATVFSLGIGGEEPQVPVRHRSTHSPDTKVEEFSW